MASHKSVVHTQRGFRMSKNYAEQVMRDHCSITWVVKGETIRDTTDEERIALRAEQAQQVKRMEPLAPAEIHGLTFQAPLSGKSATEWEKRWISEAQDFAERCRAA